VLAERGGIVERCIKLIGIGVASMLFQTALVVACGGTRSHRQKNPIRRCPFPGIFAVCDGKVFQRQRYGWEITISLQKNCDFVKFTNTPAASVSQNKKNKSIAE
jgi:hypothetical protein